MAGDWIKMRTDLYDDPAVIGMAASLKTNEFDIVGRLHLLWSWADKHTAYGFVPHITEKWIDKYVEKSGFASQMICVGWLVSDDKGVTFPHFDRHNGKSAKSRAENTERARLSRKISDKVVTKEGCSSQEKCDKSVSREEKRREEKSKPPKTPCQPEAYLSERGNGGGKIGPVDLETGEVLSWA